MAKAPKQGKSTTKGKATPQSHEELDEGLLIQAFLKLIPSLTKSMVAEKYLAQLLSKGAIDVEVKTVVMSKATPKEKAKALIVQVCQKKGVCKILLDLFLLKHINQQDLHDKVLTEYNIVFKRSLKERETVGLGKLQIKDEPTTSKKSRAAVQTLREGGGETVGKTGNTPAVPADLLPILRQVKPGVGKEFKKRAKIVMNKVAGRVVEYLRKQHELVLRPEFSGSSFEGTKVEKAYDFDVLVVLDGNDLERRGYNPQFYYLRPKRADNPKFEKFLTNSGNIDPEKIKSTMFSWVQLALHSLFPGGSTSEFIVKVRKTGPAVTLSIQSRYEKDLGTIDVDLVAAFEVIAEQFVAKPYKASPGTAEETMIRQLWRKSFSLLEKERLHGIDKDGGCRRQCLRLLKFIRLREATFKRFASYHYKILLLNECEKFQKREDWIAGKLADRFWGLLASLKACLEEGILRHCMDRRINIFERIEPKVLKNMGDRVNKIMSKQSIELKKLFEKEQIS